MAIQPKKDSTLPRGPTLALAAALDHQASEEPDKKFRQDKKARAAKLRELVSPESIEKVPYAMVSKPLSNRLDKLEAEALDSTPTSHNVHINYTIINPDGTVHEVLETIIKDGAVIRDDWGRPLG